MTGLKKITLKNKINKLNSDIINFTTQKSLWNQLLSVNYLYSKTSCVSGFIYSKMNLVPSNVIKHQQIKNRS